MGRLQNFERVLAGGSQDRDGVLVNIGCGVRGTLALIEDFFVRDCQG